MAPSNITFDHNPCIVQITSSYRTCSTIQNHNVIPAKAGIQSNGKVDCPKIPVQDDPRGKPQPPKPSTGMDPGLRQDDGIVGVIPAEAGIQSHHRHTGLDPASKITTSYRRRPVSRIASSYRTCSTIQNRHRHTELAPPSRTAIVIPAKAGTQNRRNLKKRNR